MTDNNVDVFANIKAISKDILNQWITFKKLIENGTPLDVPMYGYSESLRRIDSRISAVMSFSSSLSVGRNSDANILPTSSIVNAESNLNQAKAQMDAITSIINSLISQGQPPQRIEQSNGHIYTINGSAHNIQPYIPNLMSYIDAYIQQISLIIPLVRVNNSISLTNVVKEYENVIDELRNSQADLEKQLVRSKEIVEEQASLNSNTLSTFNRISENGNVSNTILENSREIKGQLDIILGEGKSIALQSEKLQTAIVDAEVKFTSFNNDIDSRNVMVGKLLNRVNESETKNIEREVQIDKIVEKSEEMLNGSTVATLANSFQSTYEDYKQATLRATRAYWWANGILAFLVIPLGLYVLPFKLQGFLGLFQGQTVELAGVIARGLILLPALLLVTFASRRYRELFELEREYAHRATIAKSIHAFKKEAPKYEEEITTAVFLGLQRNPSESVTDAIKLRKDESELQIVADKLIEAVKKYVPSGISKD